MGPRRERRRGRRIPGRPYRRPRRRRRLLRSRSVRAGAYAGVCCAARGGCAQRRHLGRSGLQVGRGPGSFATAGHLGGVLAEAPRPAVLQLLHAPRLLQVWLELQVRPPGGADTGGRRRPRGARRRRGRRSLGLALVGPQSVRRDALELVAGGGRAQLRRRWSGRAAEAGGRRGRHCGVPGPLRTAGPGRPASQRRRRMGAVRPLASLRSMVKRCQLR
mmetsp:Transcript_28668/g.95152  ORF Transcript_28668/g.95152 Transcript_28668/m.95152 type:complete len:218 (+) Transcript_28668:692-1345(+)